MDKAVFLDRDGVLIKNEKEHVHKIEDFELYPDVVNGLRELKDYKLFVVTNQPGPANGIYTKEQSKEFNNYMKKELYKHGIVLTDIYSCYHHPKVSDCECRKPKPGMLLQVAREYNIDLKNSWMIGDRRSDIKAGQSAGCKTILVRTGDGGEGGNTDFDAKPDFIADNLNAAANIINNSEIQVLILAGGFGKRIAALAPNLPKPMIDIKGKPLLERQVEFFKQYGFTNYVFSLHYMPDVIKNYFGDGSKLGVNIKYAVESEPLGTGGAVKFCQNLINSEDFLLISGDVALNFDVNELVGLHRKNKSVVTPIVRVTDHPQDSDLYHIDENKKVSKLFKKKEGGEKYTNIGNTGLYIINKAIFNELPKGPSSLEHDTILPMINKGLSIYVYMPKDGTFYIKDMGTPERYEKVIADYDKWKLSKR